MPIDRSIKVPKDILLPLALKARRDLKTDPDKWNDYDIEKIRLGLPAQFHGVPIVNIRNQCCGLRKSGKLGRLGRHGGASRAEAPPEGYDEYLQSDHWKDFRQEVLEFWEFRCCWCNGDQKLDVHHRTYERLYEEKMIDCVCLCRLCHKVADIRRRREIELTKAESCLF